MPDLQALESQKKRADGAPALRLVRPGDEVHLLSSDAHMPPAHSYNPRNSGSADPMAITNLDQQIEQIQAMALRHYPESTELRQEFVIAQLLQRLREYHAKFLKLEVR
jgi:hypothetical protein